MNQKSFTGLKMAEELKDEFLTKMAALASRTPSPLVKDYVKFMTRDTNQASQIHLARLRKK